DNLVQTTHSDDDFKPTSRNSATTLYRGCQPTGQDDGVHPAAAGVDRGKLCANAGVWLDAAPRSQPKPIASDRCRVWQWREYQVGRHTLRRSGSGAVHAGFTHTRIELPSARPG